MNPSLEFEKTMKDLDPQLGPLEAIKLRLDELDYRQHMLVPAIGSRARVSEILSGKREITLPMVRKLHTLLEIPLEILVKERERNRIVSPDSPKFIRRGGTCVDWDLNALDAWKNRVCDKVRYLFFPETDF